MIDQLGLIRTKDKFPMVAWEDEENVNPGMYGKLICAYMQSNLPQYGIQVKYSVNEDWGWWLAVQMSGFKMGLCIYSDAEIGNNPHRYAILSSIVGGRKWSWRKFQKIDVSKEIEQVFTTLESLFNEDEEIQDVERCDGFPF